MEALICSPDLFVVQVEMDIYTMLKKVPYASLKTSTPRQGKYLDVYSEEPLRNGNIGNDDVIVKVMTSSFFV